MGSVGGWHASAAASLTHPPAASGRMGINTGEKERRQKETDGGCWARARNARHSPYMLPFRLFLLCVSYAGVDGGNRYFSFIFAFASSPQSTSSVLNMLREGDDCGRASERYQLQKAIHHQPP